MFKTTGKLATLTHAQKEGEFKTSFARAARIDLRLHLTVFDQGRKREGLDPFRSEDHSALSALFLEQNPDSQWTEDMSNNALLPYLHVYILQRGWNVIDKTLNAQRILTLGFDIVYGMFYWPDDCPKLMMPHEIVERTQFLN
jgi:hypothetical protein